VVLLSRKTGRMAWSGFMGKGQPLSRVLPSVTLSFGKSGDDRPHLEQLSGLI